jgi:MFS family permease
MAIRMSKNIKIFINYFLGPLLFAWLSFSIYRNVTHQPHLEESWIAIRSSFDSYRILLFVCALLLVGVNWGIEAWKWQTALEPVFPVNFRVAFKAILAGVAFSVTMPNRVGEYIGRMMYLPEGQRLRTISVTLVGSFAQLLVTMVAGTAGLLALQKDKNRYGPQIASAYPYLLPSLIAFCLLFILFYFRVAHFVPLVKKWLRKERYMYLIEALQSFTMQRLGTILLLSFLRYGTFLIQYLLVFYLFGVDVPLHEMALVMSIVFLAITVIPSIALVELGMRGQITLQLMGAYTANALGIALTTVSVWFINLILPAIIGSLLILKVKVFKRKNEKA